MYIQEIIIDGFKSYAQKTVITGFDPQFNAITGLNGSGKSNILDSICFVLGITNLSQVRVGNLQELVYKQGQAGVSKATVTIIFNNADVSTSPIGYEAYKQISVTRQVAIGGKNKFMINGHTVQQNQVQNFFHSVQLNVNNPHFLIMQGRITKVLNMKPEEVLSMIEEAAGTRMFETKKQASLRTMEKKQAKVDEITKCIDEEITPTLENLRAERLDYHKFQKNQIEYERLIRLCVAFEFHEHEQKLLNSEQYRKVIDLELEGLQKQISLKNEETTIIDKEIQELIYHRDQEIDLQMTELKNTESALSKDIVKMNTLLSNQVEMILAEEDTSRALQKNISSTEKSLLHKQQQLSALEKDIEEKISNSQRIEKEYLSKCEMYQNIFAGKTDENTTNLLSHNEQILTWEKYERETASKLQTNEQRLIFTNKKKQDFEKRHVNIKSSSSFNEIMMENDSLQEMISERTKRVVQFASSKAQLKEISSQSAKLSNQLNLAVARYESLQATLQARLNFDYSNPEKNFDRELRVKGLIANLFRMKDKQHAVGLEVIAGGKLREVVVDNEQTGKLILEKGNLKKRFTILPLNKLSTRALSAEKIANAKSIARSMCGNAFLPIELISFPEDVRRAMEYVFGSVLLCSSAEIAKAIAFNPNIRVKTVTVDGDCYDPAGTLTGGSSQALGSLLEMIHDFNETVDTIDQLKVSLQQCQQQMKAVEPMVQQEQVLLSEIELFRHTLVMNENKLAESDYSHIASQRQGIEAEIVEIEAERKQLMELLGKAKSELARLSKAEKSVSKSKEQKLKDFEKEMKILQQDCNVSKNQLIAAKSKREGITTEIKSLETEVQLLRDQKKQGDSMLTRYEQDKKAIEQKISLVRRQYDEVSNLLNEKTLEIRQYSNEIQQLEKAKEDKNKDIQRCQLEFRKVSHQLQRWEKEIKDSQKLIQSYLKEYAWISKEKLYFGHVNTDFDFNARDLNQCQNKLQELKLEQEKLSRKVNKKVMGMIEAAENEYDELNRKREVILKDKAKIESVIEELDVKKIQSLQKTYDQVNKDFGSIFSMLLPGTCAKLEAANGGSVMEGLEVKVAFNNVWKDSLTELSGGQRSLLALSLILALLLFKPAPMYILDEVDAALDLSHTQNIGLMIRTHFASSQFIVVSLKEGMFNNANVVFRTKFVDGISAVSRTVSGLRAKNHALSSQFQSPHVKSVMENENVENEISQAVNAALTARKNGNGKKALSKQGKQTYADEEEDNDVDLDAAELEVAHARKRGKTAGK